ncbi:MAG: hypothetical protein K2W78_04650 [Xanthobacteraceae bacterium]|nr:hypothetical protein [Xanthobacteraceae bacterium]
MTYIFSFNAGWIVGAAVIGFGMGWISPISRSQSLSVVSARWIVVALAGLLAIALAHLLPGRLGYALDLALVMIGAYLAGCAVGAALRYWLLLRPSAS